MSVWVQRGKYNKIKTGGDRLARAACVTTLFPIWYMNPSHLTRKKKREIMNLYSSASSFTGSENRERFMTATSIKCSVAFEPVKAGSESRLESTILAD